MLIPETHEWKGLILLAKGKFAEWLTEDGLLLLRKWARNGLTDEQIAENMEIGIRTLYQWKERFPQISHALKKTKDIYDSEVEEALERSALGYYVEEETWKNRWNPDTKEYELVLDTRQKKWIKPDPTAQIFWLKNRDKQHWRDRQDVALETGAEEQAICIIPKREIIQEPTERSSK